MAARPVDAKRRPKDRLNRAIDDAKRALGFTRQAVQDDRAVDWFERFARSFGLQLASGLRSGG